MQCTKLVLFMLAGLALTEPSFAQTSNTAAPAPIPTPPAVVAQPAAPPPATPAKSADAMEGLAVVYSDKLNGRKTASGQVFHQSALTAAHPSLPFGTKVKVTNIQNNKSVEVRINDRGPKQAGRVIDLSSAAAAKVGIRKTGSAQVQLEVVGEPPAAKALKVTSNRSRLLFYSSGFDVVGKESGLA